MRQRPLLDCQDLVDDGVVQDQMDFKIGRHLIAELGEELLELPRAAAEGADDLAGRGVQFGEEGGGTGPSARAAGPSRTACASEDAALPAATPNRSSHGSMPCGAGDARSMLRASGARLHALRRPQPRGRSALRGARSRPDRHDPVWPSLRDESRRGCCGKRLRHFDPESLGDLVKSPVDLGIWHVGGEP